MYVYMFASQVIWGSKPVVSEPPTAPGCYDFYTMHRTRNIKLTSYMC